MSTLELSFVIKRYTNLHVYLYLSPIPLSVGGCYTQRDTGL